MGHAGLHGARAGAHDDDGVMGRLNGPRPPEALRWALDGPGVELVECRMTARRAACGQRKSLLSKALRK